MNQKWLAVNKACWAFLSGGKSDGSQERTGLSWTDGNRRAQAYSSMEQFGNHSEGSFLDDERYQKSGRDVLIPHSTISTLKFKIPTTYVPLTEPTQIITC